MANKASVFLPGAKLLFSAVYLKMLIFYSGATLVFDVDQTFMMSSILIRNIGQLIGGRTSPTHLLRGSELAELPILANAFLLIEDGRILDFGSMENAPERAAEVIDARGGFVLPGWVDSHTHLVYAGSREREFVGRIKGLSYQEISNRGGGILHSALRLADTSEDELFDQAWERLEAVMNRGTVGIEIKSGYGLTKDAELKILRVARKLKEAAPIPVKTTFLGCHAIPEPYRSAGDREGYLALMLEEVLPVVAGEGLADYIDVFCEKVAFSPEETDRILAAGEKYGLRGKIHTNQFYSLGGIETAIRHRALSVDHLEVVNEQEIELLAANDTIATLLPSAPFFLNDHYPPGRELIDAGVAVALASDYNPGSSPSGNMPFVLSLACIKSRLLPEEAINAATINGAYALEVEQDLGSIEKGKKGSVILTKPMSSIAYLPYSFGSDLIERVFY